MAGLFGSKSPAPMPAPMAAPDTSAADRAMAIQSADDRQRRMSGGRASTILTSGQGVTDEEKVTAKKRLLGS